MSKGVTSSATVRICSFVGQLGKLRAGWQPALQAGCQPAAGFHPAPHKSNNELVERFLVALSKRALTTPEVPRVFRYQRDPKDEPYINLAIAAGAGYLISRDTDVLDLASPGDPDGVRLRRHAPRPQILDPVSFLADIRTGSESPGQR
jgi:hypothetical protein